MGYYYHLLLAYLYTKAGDRIGRLRDCFPENHYLHVYHFNYYRSKQILYYQKAKWELEKAEGKPAELMEPQKAIENKPIKDHHNHEIIDRVLQRRQNALDSMDRSIAMLDKMNASKQREIEREDRKFEEWLKNYK